jgi:DNA-binding Xre family transcriptional regulator
MPTKQRKVSKEAIKIIKTGLKSVFDKNLLSLTRAFRAKKGEIKGISVSGRTLEKIFHGHHIHLNTIKKICDELGEVAEMENGVIYINLPEKIEENEEEETEV